MSIFNLGDKSEKLMFWNKCRLLSTDIEFRDLVLKEGHSSKWIKVVNRGDKYKGEVVYHISEFAGEVGFF